MQREEFTSFPHQCVGSLETKSRVILAFPFLKHHRVLFSWENFTKELGFLMREMGTTNGQKCSSNTCRGLQPGSPYSVHSPGLGPFYPFIRKVTRLCSEIKSAIKEQWLASPKDSIVWIGKTHSKEEPAQRYLNVTLQLGRDVTLRLPNILTFYSEESSPWLYCTRWDPIP